MMRVLTPNGNVIEVEKAEAIVEKRVSFNGRDIRLCQTAKDMHIAKLNGRICGAKRSHSVFEQPNCYQSV